MTGLLLQEFITSGVLAFILVFVRIGTAIMIMPGLGDSFVPERIRLHIAVALSLVLFPLVLPYVPRPVPGTMVLFFLIFSEFLVGLFFGMIARILMMALDTAGMVISTASGLSNAQLFNPAFSAQGSLMGAFLSITGVLILFTANLHHLLITGMIESYELFPLGTVPDVGSMAQMIAHTVSTSFAIGVKIGAPFLVMILVVYAGMGVLSRLMPQVQVFMLAIPVQILLALVTMLLVLSASFLYWAQQFEEGMIFFLKSAGAG